MEVHLFKNKRAACNINVDFCCTVPDWHPVREKDATKINPNRIETIFSIILHKPSMNDIAFRNVSCYNTVYTFVLHKGQ